MQWSCFFSRYFLLDISFLRGYLSWSLHLWTFALFWFCYMLFLMLLWHLLISRRLVRFLCLLVLIRVPCVFWSAPSAPCATSWCCSFSHSYRVSCFFSVFVKWSASVGVPVSLFPVLRLCVLMFAHRLIFCSVLCFILLFENKYFFFKHILHCGLIHCVFCHFRILKGYSVLLRSYTQTQQPETLNQNPQEKKKIHSSTTQPD